MTIFSGRKTLTFLVALGATISFMAPVKAQEQNPESGSGSKTMSVSNSSQSQFQFQYKYETLYSLMKSLDFTGWTEVKSGLYLKEGGRYRDSLSTEDRYLRSSSFVSGKEGILVECGCQAVAQKVFRRGNRFVTFEAFKFDSTVGALAGYNFLRSGSTTVVTRGDGSSEDSQSISFWQDKYFFRIFTSEEDDSEAKEVVSAIAGKVNEVIRAHSSPSGPILIIKSLPSLDRVKGSEKVVRGSLTASHYYSVPYIGKLVIESARGAAVADYQVYYPNRERLKVLYIDYGDQEKAQRAYINFVSSMSELQPPVEGGSEHSPRTLFKLNKRFVLCELKPRGRLVVISGARKKNSCQVLSSQI
ncbi:hypothetical protein GC174_08470 [bacterium]|nr:hypothetical protein [bacterium]